MPSGSRFEFRLLGPMGVFRDGMSIPLGPAKQRALLTGLLLDSGKPVSTDRLVTLLWDEYPPASAMANIRTYTTRLRAVLADPGGVRGSRLVRRPPGYLVAAQPTEVDLVEFVALANQGRRALALGRSASAVDHLSRAMALWRGTVAAEGVVRGESLAARLIALDELRLATLVDLVAARLGVGEHVTLVPELRAAVSEHPLHERLWGQLIVALYRSGDAQGALAAFTQARRVITDRLGIEPGQELVRLQRAVLGRDPALHGPCPQPPGARVPEQRSAPVPHELPATVVGFVGRGHELARIERAVTRGRAPVAVVIHGPGGVGKSALAVRAAHRLAERFPGGQLYVNLSEGALPAAEALARFLRSLGVPSREVPATLGEAAARYRSLTSGRRLLVVLDNVSEGYPVEPLLPASPGCAALLTSRGPVPLLSGATRVPTPVLTPGDAIALLAGGCGQARLAAEPGAVARLAVLCGHLPLALRIAGARLAARPDWTVSDLVDELGDEARRLDGLTLGALSVRESLRVDYQALLESPHGPLDGRLFRLVALLRLPAVSPELAAVLVGVNRSQASAGLERLVGAQLLVRTSRDGYRMPDLVRLYGMERAEAEESMATRTVAVRRALWYLVGSAEYLI